MGRSEADELQDDERTYSESQATAFPKRVVEDLRNGLCNWRVCYSGGISHAEAENNVEKYTEDIGEEHGERDSPRSFDFGFADSSLQVSALGLFGTGNESYSSVMCAVAS